jgi:A118 family predicted phage portal protein
MFQKILEFLRGVWSKMFNSNNVKQALGVDVLLSPLMTEALQLWALMYEGNPPYLDINTESMNLPVTISSEIARAVTIEMECEVSGSPRADFLTAQIKPVLDRIRQDVEKGCAKGGLWWKPYVKGNGIAIDTVQADQGYPISFDAQQNMTGVIFSDQRKIGQYYYTRLESHNLTDNGYEIRNAAFRSSGPNMLGTPCALSEVAQWAELLPQATITGVDKPLFGYFRYPVANNIDPTSPLSVSCFARAQDGKKVKLIQRADEIFSNLVWEFDSGKRALYVDELAFDKGTDGKPKLPDRRLYRTLKSSGQIGKGEEMFNEWSPEFREAAIKSGLNDVLRQVEFACGLSYGVLSDPQVQALTATEVKTTQQRFWSTVSDTQKALETALNQLLYAMDTWATLYGLAPRGTYATDFTFDDSIIVDDAAQLAKDTQALTNGAMSKIEWRMRQYDETEEVAKQKVGMARAESRERLADKMTTVRQ